MKTIQILTVLSLVLGMNVDSFAKKAKSGSSAAPATSSSSFSRNYGLAGCGLGSQVIGKKGGFVQVFAATTNGTSGSQTFGITSGTSNCIDSDNDEVAKRVDRFVMANNVALATDIARGNGETLGGLSMLMGCSNSEALSGAMKSHFGVIYPNAQVAPNEVTDSILTVILNSGAVECSNVKKS